MESDISFTDDGFTFTDSEGGTLEFHECQRDVVIVTTKGNDVAGVQLTLDQAKRLARLLGGIL